jgi:hypothetical protein
VTAYVVAPCRVSKFATQRSTRGAGTETVTMSTTSVSTCTVAVTLAP